MRRLEITLRKPGQDGARQVVLGRFGSMLVTVLLTMVAIATVVVAIVFGYLAFGLLLVALLIAIVVAVLRGAFHSFRR
jgi:hypothetical protein